MVKTIYTIHCDGGSRGNPGAAAYGYTIAGTDGTKKEHGEYIGTTTNNVAEYKAVIAALKKLPALVGKTKAHGARVEVRVDSELLERQINGKYKISHPEIQKLFLELWNTKVEYDDISFTHVRREMNTAADRMVNATLDKEAGKLV